MADERLLAAANLLDRHYGRTDLASYRTGWGGLVRFVLERALSAKKFAKSWAELEETWLLTVSDVAQSTRSDLHELLEPQGISKTTVGLLHRLAVWWQTQLDAGRTPFESSPAALEAEWEELSAHEPIWIARIFCVIGGLRKFPVTRGCWRIGCRHSWLSWYDDPGEVPDFFASSADGTPFELGQLAEWLTRVGDDHCGPKPKCAGCPLESLLGENGPCEPEAGDS